MAGKTLFVSESNLAENLGYTREHVGKTLRSLRKRGIIKRSGKKHDNLSTYDYEVDIAGVCSAYPPVKDILHSLTGKKDYTMIGTNISSGCKIISHNRMTNICICDKVEDEDGPNSSTLYNSIPTLEEIRQYAAEIKSLINPEEFYNTCSKLNWIIGGKPVQDWKKLFEKWNTTRPAKKERTDIQNKASNNQTNSSVDDYTKLFEQLGIRIGNNN